MLVIPHLRMLFGVRSLRRSARQAFDPHDIPCSGAVLRSIPHDQRPDHRLRIGRRVTHGRIMRCKFTAKPDREQHRSSAPGDLREPRQISGRQGRRSERSGVGLAALYVSSACGDSVPFNSIAAQSSLSAFSRISRCDRAFARSSVLREWRTYGARLSIATTVLGTRRQ
jgi:hypothetical protein